MPRGDFFDRLFWLLHNLLELLNETRGPRPAGAPALSLSTPRTTVNEDLRADICLFFGRRQDELRRKMADEPDTLATHWMGRVLMYCPFDVLATWKKKDKRRLRKAVLAVVDGIRTDVGRFSAEQLFQPLEDRFPREYFDLVRHERASITLQENIRNRDFTLTPTPRRDGDPAPAALQTSRIRRRIEEAAAGPPPDRLAVPVVVSRFQVGDGAPVRVLVRTKNPVLVMLDLAPSPDDETRVTCTPAAWFPETADVSRLRFCADTEPPTRAAARRAAAAKRASTVDDSGRVDSPALVAPDMALSELAGGAALGKTMKDLSAVPLLAGGSCHTAPARSEDPDETETVPVSFPAESFIGDTQTESYGLLSSESRGLHHALLGKKERLITRAAVKRIRKKRTPLHKSPPQKATCL